MSPFLYLFITYGWNFSTPVGAGFCYANAVCYFAYRMLDEMDGKQARRTGNSSPLGLIFDHGCDAFTCGLESLIFAKCAMVGDNFVPILAILISCMPFYFATLEEYYVGGLWLPVMNGVTDGSAILIGVNILIGILGSEWWAVERDIIGIHTSVGHFCFYLVFMIQCYATLKNFYEISKAYRFPVHNGEHYREPVVVGILVQQIVAFFLVVFVFSLLYTSITKELTDKVGQVAYLSFFCIHLSFVCTHMSMNIMLAHLTQH